MKRIIGLIVLIALIFLGKKSWGIIQKIRHAKRLKFAVSSVKFPKLNLSNLFTDIETKVVLLLKNFSSSTFNLEQISIEVFSPSGKLVAEQKTPLKEAFEIKPNKNNELPLTFLISSSNLKALIKEAGGIANVGANFITTGEYGIPLHLKGFVVADGVTIDIDEQITV